MVVKVTRGKELIAYDSLRHETHTLAHLCVTTLVVATVAQLAAASEPQPGEQPARGGSQQVTPSQTSTDGIGPGEPSNQPLSAPAAQAWPGTSCEVVPQSGWVHISRNQVDASVHGWWLKKSGDCPSNVKVTVRLQARLCQGWYCWWETVARKNAKIYEKKHVPVHKRCDSTVAQGVW